MWGCHLRRLWRQTISLLGSPFIIDTDILKALILLRMSYHWPLNFLDLHLANCLPFLLVEQRRMILLPNFAFVVFDLRVLVFLNPYAHWGLVESLALVLVFVSSILGLVVYESATHIGGHSLFHQWVPFSIVLFTIATKNLPIALIVLVNYYIVGRLLFKLLQTIGLVCRCIWSLFTSRYFALFMTIAFCCKQAGWVECILGLHRMWNWCRCL